MTDIPSFHVEVKKDGLRQMQDGTIKISLTVHPNDMESLLPFVSAPAGQRFQCALAAIGDDEEAVDLTAPGQAPPELRKVLSDALEDAKPRRKFSEMLRSEQAGMLCKDAVFQRWLGVNNQYDARDVVVQRCGVLSRSDIDTDAHATAIWQQELARFDQDTGRTAEIRG